MFGSALALDIGGTSVRAAISDADGRVLASERAPTPERGEPGALSNLVKRLSTAVEAMVRPDCPAAGVAIPGIWDRATGVMQRANNLPALVGIDVRSLLASALGRPIELDTDVNAAGWAQWRAFDPRPARFIYLSIGTGVGGSVVLDGQIVRHTDGGAGHFGDLMICAGVQHSDPRLRQHMTLEVALQRIRSTSSPSSTAEARDRVASRFAPALAAGLRQIACIYAPDTIALGGGVVDHEPELVELTVAAFHRSEGEQQRNARLVRAPLGSDNAGVIGAALRAMQR
jgi:glucokinase